MSPEGTGKFILFQLKDTTDIKQALEDNDAIFIAVGTPPSPDGSANLQYIEAVAKEIARHMNRYKVIVNKSTVPVGTGQCVKGWLQEELFKRGLILNSISSLTRNFCEKALRFMILPIQIGSLSVLNLAMKITFNNEVANLCEKVGADVQNVAKAMGRDGRISSKFLHPEPPGYGGSCFPKDTLALAETGRQQGFKYYGVGQ